VRLTNFTNNRQVFEVEAPHRVAKKFNVLGVKNYRTFKDIKTALFKIFYIL